MVFDPAGTYIRCAKGEELEILSVYVPIATSSQGEALDLVIECEGVVVACIGSPACPDTTPLSFSFARGGSANGVLWNDTAVAIAGPSRLTQALPAMPFDSDVYLRMQSNAGGTFSAGEVWYAVHKERP